MLFDEIEKAHPDVMHLLLQILEEGKITDSLGRKIDFRNTIIIMTSNVGAELIRRQTTLGFGAAKSDDSYDVMRDKILEETKRVFKPEFLNRLDDTIVFHTLTKPDLITIVDLEVGKVIQRIKAKDIHLILEESAKNSSSKRATIRFTVLDRCAALSSAISRILWQRSCYEER